MPCSSPSGGPFTCTFTVASSFWRERLCKKWSGPSVPRGRGKGVSQAPAPLPLISSGTAGKAASLQGYPASPPRAARMEESPWPGTPSLGPSSSKDGEQQGSHRPTGTNLLLATAALAMNATRLPKPLTTATARQQRTNRCQFCRDWFGKVSFSARPRGRLARHPVPFEAVGFVPI